MEIKPLFMCVYMYVCYNECCCPGTSTSTSNIHTWKKVEEDVDEILVSKGDVISVSLIVGDHLIDPATLTHTSQVHQHHSRVHS